MKAILSLQADEVIQLEIHSENDMETIALQAWSERYFNKASSDTDISKVMATLLIVRTLEFSLENKNMFK